jgi:hypothetical protein
MDCVYHPPDPNGVAFVVGRPAPNLHPYVHFATYKSEEQIEKIIARYLSPCSLFPLVFLFFPSTDVSIAVLALGGSFLEIVARVMTIGATSSIHWLGSGYFNLDHWTGGEDSAATGEPDLLGWRTLEVITVVVNGLSAWVDAMEWLFLSAILLLVYRSVASQNTTSAWSMRWATLGLFIGVLSFVDLSFNVLRFQSWGTFSVLALLVTTLTRLVLMPVWLVWLSRILYVVQMATGEKIDEAFGTREGNNDMEMM